MAEIRLPTSARGTPATQGLSYQAAQHVDVVACAWEMVYAHYRRAELIEQNRFRLHAPRQAFAQGNLVITGCIGEVAVTTLSAFADGPVQLPLDEVFGDTLNTLRRDGLKLMQVGLFADRRRKLGRATEAMFQLMRVAFACGVSRGVSDFVIGIDPDDVVYYARTFGFQTAGSPRPYAAINHRPIQLMRLPVDDTSSDKPHAAVRYLRANPVPAERYANAIDLSPDALKGTLLGEYWQWRFGESIDAQQEGAA